MKALHQLVQNFVETQSSKKKDETKKVRNDTLRRNTIQQRQHVMTINGNRDQKRKLNKINGELKSRNTNIKTTDNKRRRTTEEENLSMVNTIERLQSEIGEFGEEKDGDVKEEENKEEQPTIMLEDNSSGSGSASGSGQDEEIEEEDHSSNWVPLVIEHENLVTTSIKKDNSNFKKQKDMMFTKENNRTADEKEVDVIDNQDIEDSIQMEKEDEDEAGGDDESEEQRTISALFKLHDNQQNDDELRKEKNENQMIKNISNDNTEGTQKVVMFQGKHRKQQKYDSNVEKPIDIDPSVVKEALQIFSSKNKQSPVKKHEETISKSNNNNNNNNSNQKTLSNVVLSIPSDHLKNLTGDKPSKGQAKDEGKTIILAVPVKLSDKDMVEKQVEAIKEKLLSIGNYQKSEDEKVISSSLTSKEDKMNNMETTKDENKQATSFTLPSKNVPTEEQHLQDITKNPISSVTGNVQPVLDELKGDGSQNEPEKQNKGFLEAIAKLKSEKEAVEHKITSLSSSTQLNTEQEDNSDESKLAPESQPLQQPQQDDDKINTAVKAAKENPPSPIQQIKEQQKHQQNPLLQPVPKVAFEKKISTTDNFPHQQHQLNLHKKPLTTTPDVVGNKATNLSELQENVDEENEDEKDLDEMTGDETLQNTLTTTTSEESNAPAQQQQDTSHFKSNPFNPSRIPMSFHASIKQKDGHQQDDGAWCKASCKTLCAPDCQFKCCRAADRKNKIKKIKKEGKKVKSNKTNKKGKTRKTKMTSIASQGKYSSSTKSKQIEMKAKSINERINKLISEKFQSSTNDYKDTSSSSIFHNLPHLSKFNKKINYDSTKGHKFLKETQEKLHSLIEMLSKSSNQLTAVTTAEMSPSKKSLTCDVRCKVVCLPSCRFDCCKHDDEKR